MEEFVDENAQGPDLGFRAVHVVEYAFRGHIKW